MYRINKPLAKHRLIYVFISGLLSSTAFAQAQPSLEITATGSQEATQSILTPTKILQGDELLNKLGATQALENFSQLFIGIMICLTMKRDR